MDITCLKIKNKYINGYNTVSYDKRSHYIVDRETRVVIRSYIGTDQKNSLNL